mgnify:CR=1 FL=1
MNRTLAWTDWALNLITGIAIFVGGSIIYEHELIVSPRAEIASALKLNDDQSLKPMTERELWGIGHE